MARTEVEPPMILNGMCAVDCGVTGLLAIIAVMWVTVTVFFFGSLWVVDNPCDGPLGACSTISCVCGNILEQGYVFMFVSLVLTSIILVQRISAMPHQQLNHHRVNKPLLIIGALLLTLTGIFPERYGANGGVEYQTIEVCHLLGVTGATLW
jgi:hypothetical protein